MNIGDFLRGMNTTGYKRPLPLLSFPSARLIGADPDEITRNADLQARGMKAVADRCPSAASVCFMDLSVEAECFGAEIRRSPGDVPSVAGTLIRSREDSERLAVPGVRSMRAGLYADAAAKAKELIADRPVFAGITGPFSLAGRLAGASESMLLCYDDPETMRLLLGKCTAFLKGYAGEFAKAGADGIILSEPLAGLLSPSLCEEFSEPYVREIADAVRGEDFAVIYHNCGNAVVRLSDSVFRSGADAYHFGNAISLRDVLVRAPADVLVMGNLDPVSLFKDGTPETMTAAVSDIMRECGSFPNFVLSSGCDIPASASWDNIDAFFAASDAYYGR